MAAGHSPGAIAKGIGISFVFGGITLFAVGIIQRAQVALQPVPLLAPLPPVRVIGKSKQDVPRPAVKPSQGDTTPAPLVHAVPVYQAEPPYSAEARRARYAGKVHVSVVIDEHGSVQNIQILDSPGLGLDEKIIETLHRWKFKPATRGREPVSEKATIEITFRLL